MNTAYKELNQYKESVKDALTPLLADTTILYLKARNYHWNVTGPYFSHLHLLFEDLYQDLEKGADQIAERIRALGFQALASFTEYMAISVIEEETSSPGAQDMIKRLSSDYEKLIHRSQEAMKMADKAKDAVSADLIVERIGILSKHLWILKSHQEF